jgi:hypothetical protein
MVPESTVFERTGNSAALLSIKTVQSEFGQEGYVKLERVKRLVLSALMTTALGAATLVTVPKAYAEPDHGKCQRDIERKEVKLDQAIRKHGERSHQADQRRRDLNAERERCWNSYHGWWNGHDHQWHTDRDWEDRHDDRH